jgi:hypothetical protein
MNQLSPAEKAKELYEWYYELMHDSMNVDWSIEAKCAAIKNVEEIIEELLECGEVWMKSRIKYWQEVKEELETNY